VHGVTGMDTMLAFRCSRDLGNVIKLFTAQTAGGVTDLLEAVSLDVAPLSHTPPTALKAYSALVTRLKKALVPLLGLVHRIGQVQILRRELAHELEFACRLDSNLLFGALSSLNTAVIRDVERHYYAADKFPYPTSRNPLLPELAKYLEATGQHDPTAKVYITCEPQPHIALWLAALVFTYIPKFAYDRDFDTLVRTKSNYEIDGAPFVVGIATILKQLHPTVTQQLLLYVGQYIRLHVAAYFSGAPKSSGVGPEVLNALLFVRKLGAVAVVPAAVMERCVPGYILEAAILTETPPAAR